MEEWALESIASSKKRTSSFYEAIVQIKAKFRNRVCYFFVADEQTRAITETDLRCHEHPFSKADAA